MKINLLTLCILFSSALFGQADDAAQLFKKYTGICNAYKQLPLQLEIEYKKSSNIPLYKDDSATVQGVFYIQKEGAYIQFGEAEQIINDSLVLVVMDNIKQMLLSQSNIDIAAQINKMISTPVKDSSISNLVEKYSIEQKKLDKETAVIEIRNKQNMYNTSLPYEVNTLTYNTKNGNPIKIQTLKRSLVKKTDDNKIQLSATMVTIPEKGDFFIKEDTAVYLYKSLTHNENIKLPVQLADRVEKDASANYTPVKAYKSYALIMN